MKKTKSETPSLSPLKKRIFLIITISFPVVFLICLELALRWFDYGPDLSVFKLQEVRRQTYYRMNPDVKFRYFGNSRFAPSTSPQYFQAPKPPGVFRIFCLGGSTTVGFPYYFNGSFSSYLSDRLKAVFPQRKVEIINLGMTATNSYTVLDLAREVDPYQPDLIIVYDGHNEFYGALGVASKQTVGSSRLFTLLYLRLVHLRTFQLLRDAIQWAAGLFGGTDHAVSRGTVMETLARDQYVKFGSPMYKAAYSIFSENLRDLKEHCRSAGIPLILGTQVSDLRDQPPFVSNHSAGMQQQQLSEFNQAYRVGVESQSKGVLDSAIAAFRLAISLDSGYAEARYRMAQCLDAKGEEQEGLLEYVRARDYDELRFRTDSRFNDLIRSMEDGHCFVADVEASFKSLSQDSLVGHNLITEHLHPNSRGYFLIAKSYAQVMREHGLLAAPLEWRSADTVNEARLWENRCVTELDDRMAAQSTHILMSSWPFKDQSPTLDTIPDADTLGQLAQRLAIDNLDWMKGHEQAVSFYQRRGDWKNVEREYKTLLSLAPLDLELYMNLARLYLREKRFEEIAGVLLRSIEIYPTIQAYRTLGDLCLQKGDAVGSLKYYEKVEEFTQSPAEKLQNGYMLSLAYVRSGELQKAKTRLAEILKAKPDFQPALQLLGDVNKQQEKK